MNQCITHAAGKYQHICIHCAAEEGFKLEEKDRSYPQCANCSEIRKYIHLTVALYMS